MIEEGSAGRPPGERPAEGVLDAAWREFLGRNMPELLEADAEFLRRARLVKLEAGDRRFRQGTARALREQGVFPPQLHAASEGRLWLAVPADPHVAGRDADDLALLAVQELGRRNAGIDFDAESFRPGGEPAGERPERADEIAVVVHEARHRPVRQAEGPRLGEIVEAILAHLRLERAFRIGAPIGNETVEADRVDDGAREDMRPDSRALFDEDDRPVRLPLFEAYRRRQSRGAGADDDDVIFHRLAGGQFIRLGHWTRFLPLEPDPRHPSWPAVTGPRSKGRIHDCSRP